MSTIDLVAFVAYPYLCLTIFAFGHAYRYVTDRYAWNAHSSELIEKKHLFIGSYLFHFGVLGTLVGHAVGLLVPQSIYDVVGIDSAGDDAGGNLPHGSRCCRNHFGTGHGVRKRRGF